jgi:hypothetical protein
MEQWKEVAGTDGRLLVSDQGRVKSLLRDGRILKATPDKKGYLRLRVTLDRKKYVYKMHRLVATAFVPNPYGKEQVNHINGDKHDNRADNLEWVTNRENAHHAIENGLWRSVYEGANKASRAKRKKVIATNGSEVRHFNSVVEAQNAFDSRHISDVLKGKRQHVKGWTFRYA